MSNSDFGSLTVFLFLLLAAARVLGYLFARLRQPKVMGEILAGVLLGPSLLGRFAPALSAAILPLHQGSAASAQYGAVLSFLYNFGLLLLMFASGAETKGVFNREDRRQVAWLGIGFSGSVFGGEVGVGGAGSETGGVRDQRFSEPGHGFECARRPGHCHSQRRL
jgi:Kef-type K+ transport system membrane component KefB